MMAKLHAVLVNFELFKMSIRTIRTPHGSEAGADATDTGSQGVLMVRFYHQRPLIQNKWPNTRDKGGRGSNLIY